MQEFGVQGYPTLKYFGEEKDSPSDYQGGRDSASMTNFIIGEWRKSQPPPEVRDWEQLKICISPADFDGRQDVLCFAFAASMVLQAKQLVDQHIFEKDCIGDGEAPAKKLCFLAFLPDILDSKAAGRNAYIKARLSIPRE